ncbi:hypothetical protein CLV84_0977 [Neolewinella xylanilytica]|uniref:Outer membrane protein with beta-barrel domain n=1 Tax=Neolewinella xylanilytica TaxID=1514080 RepID=A0A2S6I937_9BACT|nr:hypothetical protein [Neolewinella xylanilytica]PPK88014.1 hypothetical protein CLV84_0977 [Neolewinella xylanilytica]
MPRLASFLLLIGLLLSTLVSAQTREDAARDDLGYGSRGRTAQDTEAGQLWYGAGATIGFSANQFSNLFRIGVAPMVGYKFNNFLSAGPRVSVIYNRYHSDAFGSVDEFTDNSFSWAAGLFARGKVFRSFFVHAEYSLLSEKDFYTAPNGQLAENRTLRAIPYLGGGFNQGGGPGATGFEFLLLFRLTQPDRLNDAPYEIRSGFTYNF